MSRTLHPAIAQCDGSDTSASPESDEQRRTQIAQLRCEVMAGLADDATIERLVALEMLDEHEDWDDPEDWGRDK